MGKLKDYLLGGPTNMVVGDGRGLLAGSSPSSSPNLHLLTSTECRPSSSNSSVSPISIGSTQSTYFSRGPWTASTGASPNPSPISPDLVIQESQVGATQHPDSDHTEGRAAKVPNGVRAPRCSLAPPSELAAPDGSPRPSMESFHTASQTSSVESGTIEEVPWQDHQIPEELGLVREDAPAAIRNTVQESLDEQRAMRVSRMQAPALAKLTAESSITSLDRVSDNNPKLDMVYEGLLKPPPITFGAISPCASQESARSTEISGTQLSASMIGLEKKYHESKLRTRKGYKKFNILPGRKMRDEPTPPLLKVETPISECTSCFDDIPEKSAVVLPCRHQYCQDCFSHLVTTAIISEDTFPPKCCLTEIPKTTMHRHLSAKDWKLFSEKALEYAVPVANRYYCASPPCAKWIDTRNAKRTNGALECPHCGNKLCTVCRGPSHPSNEDCPQDFGLDRLIEQAEWAGWRRCSDCRAMVERNDGCLHMRCRCSNEFCYCCGARWHTCRCSEEDQRRREEEGRARRAQYEADQRAEEEEVRAAIAAVEAAEREIQREREAEEARLAQEAREFRRLEQERLSNIADYYEYLRGVLECVRLQQRQAIEKRHDQEWAAIDKIRDEIESPKRAAEREYIVIASKASIIAETEAKLKELQRSHAHAMLETITRHRRAQDDLMKASISSPDMDFEYTRTKTLQDLMALQDAERSVLNAQQAREMQKWKSRYESRLGDFDTKSKILQLRLQDLEAVIPRERELKSKVAADAKWFELLFDQRIKMLAEDQRRMMKSGAETPPHNPNKRDSLVMPKREAPVADPADATMSVLLGARDLGIPSPPPPSPTLQRSPHTRRRSGGRDARPQPDPNWDDIHAIASAQGLPVLGPQVRVG